MEKTSKFVKILLWVLLVISAVLLISLMANISDNDTDPTMGSWINTNLVWAYILVVIGAVVAIVSGLVHMVTDKKAARGGLLALGFFVVVAVISYSLASDAIPQFIGVNKFINDGTLTARVAKLVDTGLYATYILLGLAILSIVFSSVPRLFNK
jgi:hypothetical protein